MADSPLHAAVKFRKAADRLGNASTKGEQNAALFVKKTILANSPRRLRNVGKRGAALGVGYRPAPGSGTLVFGRGPWPILDLPTKAHFIGGGRGKKFESRQYLQFSDGHIRLGPVRHPGTHGQHKFAHGVDIARPFVPRIIDAEVKGALLVTFGI